MSSPRGLLIFLMSKKKRQWKFQLPRRDARLVRPKYKRVFCRIINCKKDARAVRPYQSIDFPIDDTMCP